MATNQVIDEQGNRSFSTAGAGNVQVTATIAAVAGKTAYITGFHVSGGGATAASIIAVTVTGLLGGTITFHLAVLAGAAAPGLSPNPLLVQFPDPLPASAQNQAIAVVVPAFGAGNTLSSVTAYGYYR